MSPPGKNQRLSQETKAHYQNLINRIGDDYIEHRWKKNPVSYSHYCHTEKSVEFAFRNTGFKAENLLEIGCGPGTWTEICLKNTDRMTIVDISSEMLNLVKKRFLGNNIEFYCLDFLSDSFSPPHTFDIIFSARAIEYMDDKEAMVVKSGKILSPGGYLIIITKNPKWVDRLISHRSYRATSQDNIHRDWVGWVDLEKYFRNHGLSDVTTYPVCLGSYYAPLKWKSGIRICDFIQNHVYYKKIMPWTGFFTESYMTIGRKP